MHALSLISFNELPNNMPVLRPTYIISRFSRITLNLIFPKNIAKAVFEDFSFVFFFNIQKDNCSGNLNVFETNKQKTDAKSLGGPN